MSYHRPDIWADEDDLVLAETVLKGIREGRMIKDSYFIASERLGRTLNACKQRWNSYLKHKYQASRHIAEAQWKKRKSLAR